MLLNSSESYVGHRGNSRKSPWHGEAGAGVLRNSKRVGCQPGNHMWCLRNLQEGCSRAAVSTGCCACQSGAAGASRKRNTADSKRSPFLLQCPSCTLSWQSLTLGQPAREKYQYHRQGDERKIRVEKQQIDSWSPIPNFLILFMSNYQYFGVLLLNNKLLCYKVFHDYVWYLMTTK